MEMPLEKQLFDVNCIRENALRVLLQAGVEFENAQIIVDSMIEADMCGVSTHGIRMLPPYIQKITSKQFSNQEIEVLKSTPVFTTVDAKNCVGAVSAYKCMKIALDKSATSGIHIVFAKNCNTLGPAFYYAEMAAKEGKIGCVCCNAPAAMPAANGLEAMLGTNPFAFACPSKTKGMIVIDMATSIVAKSKFETARINGEKLPEGWALDKEGHPTTDPVEAIQGFVLPMAGFKGYGIAMMIDIISGVMSGAGYLNKVGKFYSKTGSAMNVGQMFMVIDPAQIYPGDFKEEMDNYILTLRSSKSCMGTEILLPGDDRIKARKFALQEGITIPKDTAEKLTELFGCELLKR